MNAQTAMITKAARTALQRLGRAGALLRPDARGGFGVAVGGDARRRPVARVSAMEARAMASEGLIEADASRPQHWRISPAGRAFLQRQQDAAKPAEQNAAPADFVPQSPALRRLRAAANANGGAWFSAAELRAAERFQRDYRLSLLGPRVTADWSAPPMDRAGRAAPGGNSGPDCAFEARGRLRAVERTFGPQAIALLTDILGEEAGLEEVERRRAWPPRSAKVALKMALAMLADFKSAHPSSSS